MRMKQALKFIKARMNILKTGQNLLIFSKKMQTDQSHPQLKFPYQSCKSHPQQRGNYFLNDQPWVKFCASCALNMVLAGKKIEKELTQIQFERKVRLNSIIGQLKQALQMHEKDNFKLKIFLKNIQSNYCDQMMAKIKSVDECINSLINSRAQLLGIYQSEIMRKFNAHYERQNEYSLISFQIKKQMEYIQANFGDLISENQNTQDYQAIVKRNKKLIASCNQKILYDFQIENSVRQMEMAFSTFITKFTVIKSKIIPQILQNSVIKAINSQKTEPTSQKDHDTVLKLQNSNQNNTICRVNTFNKCENPQIDRPEISQPNKRLQLKLRSIPKKKQDKKEDSIINISTKRRSKHCLALFNHKQLQIK